ncbi:MAG TPA: bifunctional 2-C-methyl-D-erythritol 4-phosphate cytidylyltransferase/2-C-methyl-D-erythritol 2,4-cyclodiphosphate synthase [Kiloniellales bacterium]|nr:bifunctional 2-C-methyl-D-erythritol 4-phosphate cytidylyltransferase/2-C-methyl-D-erythritol 2,4-cyclodiphosphate synthase [Kiloniellales bacterium]
MDEAVALVVAAGRGERFGAETPKQYASLAGRAVLRHGLERFIRHPRIGRTQVVIDPGHRAFYDAAVEGLALPEPVAGGPSRQESVRLGLERLTADAPDRVLIHDGARPFVTSDVIERVLDALDESVGAVAALPVADTLKRAAGRRVIETVARDDLWRAQTPQGFRFNEILAAHRGAAGRSLTDDAAVAETAGLTVALVEGGAENIKITTRDDLARAERWLAGAAGETRVGQGFDVHRFGPGDHVMLCGVRITHEAGLTGHSDGDVGLHAATDAILGALGAGDIGEHFPPDDPRWRGADSANFVRYAAELIARRGAMLSHLDVTLVCERPKIGPHREVMVDRLAELLAVSRERVSVKATTTDGLGFTGRREGIAAQAVATLRLAPDDT